MDATEVINTYYDLLRTHYHDHILVQRSKKKPVLHLSFKHILALDPDLADYLLDYPQNSIKAIQIAINQFESLENTTFQVRITDLPPSATVPIRNIRAQHINTLISIQGTIRQKSTVRPITVRIKWECPACGNVLNIPQLTQEIKQPTGCGCGRRGKFRKLSEELIDAQKLVIEENADDIPGESQPKRFHIILYHDLTSPIADSRSNPGTKVIINGIVEKLPQFLRNGSQSVKYELLLTANYLKVQGEDNTNTTPTTEELKLIKQISTHQHRHQILLDNVAPTIWGHDYIKEALLVQMVGGVVKKGKDGSKRRGDIHLLLIGDPGSGKSMLLKRVQTIAPKARYVSGKGASSAGLSASVVKDEIGGGFSLEAGALVLAHNGILLLDELDKMGKEDTSALHEGLEQQSVTIAKANIQATMLCHTSVLAAANPKYGRYTKYDPISKQLNLPPALISRFDLIFPIKDEPDPSKDDVMAKFILNLHEGNDPDVENEMDTVLMRKYLCHARKLRPTFTPESKKIIHDFYVKMRATHSPDGKEKSIAITARQLEALVRLSEAQAKLRLSTTILPEDSERAVNLLNYCLNQIALDPDTGIIDQDRIQSSITASDRRKLKDILTLIKQISASYRDGIVPIDDVVAIAAKQDVAEQVVDAFIRKLLDQGDLFCPRPGFVRMV